MLARVVNDKVGILNARVVWAFIVGTPPGACSLLQRASFGVNEQRRPEWSHP